MKKFRRIYVEITNVCNMNCSFCMKTRRSGKFIEHTDFETIIKKIKGHASHVYLHVLGEPLLHPQLGLLLAICHDNGIKANITTNGTLIKMKSDGLISSPALNRVNFSVHSFEEDEQLSYNQLDTYLGDIAEFTINALTKTNMSIYFRLWNQSRDELRLKNERIIDILLKKLQIDADISQIMNKSGAVILQKRLFISLENSFVWPSTDLPEISGPAYCLGGREQLAILVDGSVVPCCLDSEGKIFLGNILSESIEDIMNSEKAKSLLHGFNNKQAVEELCKRCNYRKRFTT